MFKQILRFHNLLNINQKNIIVVLKNKYNYLNKYPIDIPIEEKGAAYFQIYYLIFFNSLPRSQ